MTGSPANRRADIPADMFGYRGQIGLGFENIHLTYCFIY